MRSAIIAFDAESQIAAPHYHAQIVAALEAKNVAAALSALASDIGRAFALLRGRIADAAVNGRFTGASDQGTECADHGAAWKEMTNACADMAGGILRKLTENSEWQLELLDETKEPVFRIRIVAESLD